MEEILRNLPETPGIYKFKGKDGSIIYVGKAINLRKRVNSYFKKDYAHSTRTRKLVEAVSNIEVIQTDSELEALILENNLIKEHRPKYNILMKDDKSYVYIKLDMSQDFPTVSVIRAKEIEKEKRSSNIKYFGPKLAAAKVYETLRIMKKIFPFRECNLEIKFIGPAKSPEELQISPDGKTVKVSNKVINYPCLDYSIKQCPGPCIGAITPEAYKKIVQQIIDFLHGKNEEVEKVLRRQMNEAAEKKLFEKAARIRDKLLALQQITERQKVTDVERKDTDIINFTTLMGRIYFNVMLIREGKLIDQENFVFDALEMEDAGSVDIMEALEAFISQYYEKASDIPKEIFVPEDLANIETLEKWLGGKRGDRVHIFSPKKGEKNRLLELSRKNAVNFANQHRIKWMAKQKAQTAVSRLAKILGMKDKELRRIEGFDISHIGGTDTVGSMVVFENGLPKNQDYRHFKIRTIFGKPDDYASMEEILRRRLKYIAGDDKSIKIKMPNKKDFELVYKIIESNERINAAIRKKSPEKIERKHFLAAKKNNKIIALGRLLPLNDRISIVSSLWVDPQSRGQRLGYLMMKKLIERSKLKRIYININKDLENYYAEFGFEILRNVPEILSNRQNEALKFLGVSKENYISMVYDVKKRKVDPSFAAKPSLLVIDGGKGQLSSALKVLKNMNLEIPGISLAKKLEEIFQPGKSAAIHLEEGDEALKLLQRIRDESHRFAITFGRNLHRKSMLER